MIRKLFVLATIVAIGSACRKEEAPHDSPSLDVPAKVFSKSLPANASPSSRPEAETTASNGPVQLTFRLYKKSVKWERSGTSIWGQVEMKNIGRKGFLIYDEIFYEPGPINDVGNGKSGIYVEILNSHGEAVKIYKPWVESADEENASAPLSEADSGSAELKRQVAAWRKQGLSTEEINTRLLNDSRLRPARGEEEKWRQRAADPHSELLPGQSTATAAWCYGRPIDASATKAPAGEFTEFAYYGLEPGQYRIRAVYDHYTPPNKKHPDGHPENVRVETPYISFEVLR